MADLDFGFTLYPVARGEGRDVSTLMDYNRRCLRLLSPRFTTVWVEDHVQWGDQATLECLTTLSFLAGEFPALRFGTLVLGQSYRNPALTAKMAANLHYITGGRFILGIGAGWKEDEYRAYGYPYPPARVRVAQMDEAIEIIRRLWNDAPATFKGAHYQVEDAYCSPRPQPAIPLMIGGGGEQLVLRSVARYADWWNYNFCTAEAYARKLDVLHTRCAEEGRDFSTIRLTYYGIVSLPTDPAQVMKSQLHVIGGAPQQVAEELMGFINLGVSHFMIRFSDIASLERFNSEVLPLLP
ncbi:MAG TPA: LLM class flavin-dependent oxidoreductase [Ktedonobacterales bacterium]|jgi:alkanesulfonate monooxygenase SsuD/methylene tetrahydromethanopterin reductase-like flavin-dependent oxidoreductase (luciferase family)